MFENVPDKKINRRVVKITLIVLALYTVMRLVPFMTAGAYKKASQFVGTPLPKSATEIQFADKSDFHGGDFYVAAKISQTDFIDITKKLELTNRTDLLTLWPAAFDSSVPWWQPSKVNDTNTFFADKPYEYSKIIARYENGAMYFKRTVPKR